ncbi:MAG: tRNA (adenosine(37)-N6)-threonylcarbamoyltransferase complex ATPase subunit type 1 TsaE [Candidatus Gastranaerophilales bacterium]|nr:tRNA (adenosine(37)-N6)-threonylcarbamoyltransferase complex ATPase subunit type 1 TsaE [Candidatus Gastranaerophilales bacterium]
MKSVKVNNLEETEKLASTIADKIKDCGGLFCLYGDVGAGKTAFTKFVAKFLNIQEKVTSPSFVILNEYHSGDVHFYHFDLYRLEKEGVNSIIDELKEYTENENSAVFIEWAEFSDNQLPDDRMEVRINYIDENKREFIFTSFGQKYEKLLESLDTCIF